MKANKLFLLGLMGLAFTACSNEEVTNEFPDGNGVVSVKIVTPESFSRAMPTELPDGTVASPVKVVGDITVALDADEGGNTYELTADDIAKGATTVKFWNVKNPTKVRVYMNGAPADGKYDNVEILNLQAAPENIAAYGEAVPALSSASESPVADTDAVKNKGNDAEDADKVYQMYNATVEMKIPVARLEVSGLKHKEHVSPETCEYGILSIDGIYLDNIKATGAGTIGDYKFAGDPNGTGADAILTYAIEDPYNDFLAAGGVWPAEASKVYAFNFYPGADLDGNPVLKIYFANAKEAVGADPKSSPRYAMISKYVAKDAGADAPGIVLEAGKVYRITNAVLDDKNIIGDEGGNTYYGVTVTVTEAEWGVELVDAVWVEQ